MALAKCLKGHTPIEGHHRSYVRPQQPLKCEVVDCMHPAVIWLDPEEAREYEWGTRTFWEPSTFATMRASNLGVEVLPWRRPKAMGRILTHLKMPMKALLRVAGGMLCCFFMFQAISTVTAQEEQRESYPGNPEFDLVIPEDPPVPQFPGTFIHMRGGLHGGNFAFFNEYCLDDHGHDNLEDFKSKFTAFSVQGTQGVLGLVPYPEGPAFKVFGRNFMPGDASVSFHATEAPYVALILCVFPTAFPNPMAFNFPAKVRVFMTSSESDVEFEMFETGDANPLAGEIFMWNFFYPDPERGFRVEVTPSQTGRTDILLGGRLGTLMKLQVPQ